MSMTDPIADMLTRIRNATQAGHRRVEIPASNQKRAMAELLKEQGYIDKFEVLEDNAQGTLRLFLKYYDRDGKRVGVIVSGGNIDAERYARLLLEHADTP